MIRMTIAYVLSFAIGLAAAWGVLTMNAAVLFSDPDASLVASIIFPPLAAIAAFILVFGLAMRIAPGLRFWAGALALVFGLGAMALALIYSGHVVPLEAGVLFLVLLVPGGWLAARQAVGR